jgi:hypothetical protein
VLRFAATEDIENPVFGIAIRDDRGAYVYAVNTQWLGRRTGMMHAHDVIEVRVPFVAALRNGSYAVDAAVTDQTGSVFHDWVHGALSFGVSGSLCQDGLVDLQADFTWRVLPQAAERATPGAGRLVRSGAAR